MLPYEPEFACVGRVGLSLQLDAWHCYIGFNACVHYAEVDGAQVGESLDLTWCQHPTSFPLVLWSKPRWGALEEGWKPNLERARLVGR